ncbi:hypothetical protein IAU60_002857 [Kwoniella sp. DSM 27419]
MLRVTRSALNRASTIGWIGLGAMGHPMALNLFTKTYLAHQQGSSSGQSQPPRFLICEQDDLRVTSFVDELRHRGGAELASRVERSDHGKGTVTNASRVLTMLPSTPQVEAVYLDQHQGILAGLRALPEEAGSVSDQPSGGGNQVEELSSSTTMSTGSSTTSTRSAGPAPPHTLLVDCTTLSPTAAQAVARTIHDATSDRAMMIDAPVSGGTVAAVKGELTVMFGSPSSQATDLAMPLLQTMARDGGVVACGSNGKGVGVKVCNNLVLAINQIALAEGLALGHSLDIDPLLLHSVINTSSGASWSSRVNSPSSEVQGSPGSRGYKGGFQTRLMLKDAGLALQAASDLDLPVPMTWAAKSIYEAVCNEEGEDWATRDFSVVYEWIKKKQAQGVERGWKADPTAT